MLSRVKMFMQRVDGDVVDVALAAVRRLQPGAVGPHADDAAAVELQRRAVLAVGLDQAVVADGDVDPAVDAQADAVGGVVGPAEARRSRPMPLTSTSALVGDAVAVVVVKAVEERRVEDV